VKLLRRALVRGLAAGIVFGVPATAVFLSSMGADVENLVRAGNAAFGAALVAAAFSAVVLLAERRPASLLRDLVWGVLLASLASVVAIALASIQVNYFGEVARYHTMGAGLEGARRQAERFLSIEDWVVLGLFALPFPVTAFCRLRGWSVLVAVPSSLFLALGVLRATTRALDLRDLLTLYVAIVAVALPLGLRLGDALANRVERLLADSAPLHAGSGDGVDVPVERADRDGPAPRIEDVDGRPGGKGDEPLGRVGEERIQVEHDD